MTRLRSSGASARQARAKPSSKRPKAKKAVVHKTLKSASKALQAKAVPKPRAAVLKVDKGGIRADLKSATATGMIRFATPIKLMPGESLRDAARRARGGQETRLPKDIKVGKRHRKDFGDLKGLAASIDARGGLIQPIAITPENVLIAGERRLKAWPLTRFKNQPIPVRVMTIDSIIAGEWDENAERKDFNLREQVAIKREIELQLGKLAEARMKAGKKADPKRKGVAGDLAARAAGGKRRTLEKAEKVIAAAESGDRRFVKLEEDMVRSGKADGPFKRLKILRQVDALKAAPPQLPGNGPYGTLVVDYPWPAEKDVEQASIDARGRAMRDYPEMAIVEGVKFFQAPAFRSLLADNCTIYFWTTNHHMPEAFVLLAAAGFAVHSTIGTWGKNKQGRGQVLRGKTEHCIMARRGKPLINLTSQTTLWEGAGWEVREDSRKPAAFYRMVEELTPAQRYAEIFSRSAGRANWDCHGDEVGKFAAEEEKGGEDVATSAYQVELGFKKPDGYRRTPAGQKIVPELVKAGDIVTTNYHTGPDRVLKVEGPHVYKPKRGEKYPYYTLTLCAIDATTKKPTGTIDEVVAVDGRLLMLFGSNDDEIFIQPEERYRTPLDEAEQREWTALLVARNVGSAGDPSAPDALMLQDLAGRGLTEYCGDEGGYWALTSAGWMRFRELEVRLAASKTSPAVVPAPAGTKPSHADQLSALERLALNAPPDIAGMWAYCKAQKWCPARGTAKLTKAGKARLSELCTVHFSADAAAAAAAPAKVYSTNEAEREWQLLCDVQAGKPIPAGDEGALEGRELIARRSARTGFSLTAAGLDRLHALDKQFATDANVARSRDLAAIAGIESPAISPKPVRRTLPGRDAELIAWASANGHVVSMTIAYAEHVDFSVGACPCGWSHQELRDRLAQDDPDGVKLRIAAAHRMDEAISAHWRDARAAFAAPNPVRLHFAKTARGARPPASPNGLPLTYVGATTAFGNPYDEQVDGAASPEQRVELYRDMLADPDSRKAKLIKQRLPELRGRNLGCGCEAGAPCHADVLLELANAPALNATPTPEAAAPGAPASHPPHKGEGQQEVDPLDIPGFLDRRPRPLPDPPPQAGEGMQNEAGP